MLEKVVKRRNCHYCLLFLKISCSSNFNYCCMKQQFPTCNVRYEKKLMLGWFDCCLGQKS